MILNILKKMLFAFGYSTLLATGVVVVGGSPLLGLKYFGVLGLIFGFIPLIILIILFRYTSEKEKE